MVPCGCVLDSLFINGVACVLFAPYNFQPRGAVGVGTRESRLSTNQGGSTTILDFTLDILTLPRKKLVCYFQSINGLKLNESGSFGLAISPFL